jgi:ATP synthase I subunit
MNERENPEPAADVLSTETAAEVAAEVTAEVTAFERIVPRLLRNILAFSVLLVAPIFWFYRSLGALGFVLGASVSYVNFRSLASGVEGLADRIVNQNSREKGARIVFRFVVRYLLVTIVAYAIFKGSLLAFYGFLWGLCVPVAALMAEAVWQGFTAFRRTP